MIIAAHNRFVDFHGQKDAHLSYYQFVHGSTKRPRTLFIKVLSPFAFGTLDFHLQGLETICVDKQIRTVAWDQFISSRIKDWQDFILIVQLLT